MRNQDPRKAFWVARGSLLGRAASQVRSGQGKWWWLRWRGERGMRRRRRPETPFWWGLARHFSIFSYSDLLRVKKVLFRSSYREICPNCLSSLFPIRYLFREFEILHEFVSHLVHESVISLVYVLDLEFINLFPIFFNS